MSTIDKALADKLLIAINNNLADKISDEFALIEKSPERVKLQFGRSLVYDNKFNSLVNQFKKETGKSLGETKKELSVFIGWVVDNRRPALSYNSWILYRSALSAIIHDSELKKLLNVPPINKRSDMPKNSTAKRAKRLPDTAYAAIVSYLRGSASKYSDITERLLFVCRKLGVRPAEIMESSIINFNGHSFLKVRSLKKENRVFKNDLVVNKYPYRYVPMIHLNDDEKVYLESTLRSFSTIETKEIFDGVYEAIRFCFLRAVKNLNLSTAQSSYSMYSARQQFSADLKATQISKPLKSMIMSHNDEATIRHHYARTSDGKPLFNADAKYEAVILQCFDSQP